MRAVINNARTVVVSIVVDAYTAVVVVRIRLFAKAMSSFMSTLWYLFLITQQVFIWDAGLA